MFSPSTGIKKGNNTHTEGRPRNKSGRGKKAKKREKMRFRGRRTRLSRAAIDHLVRPYFVLFYFIFLGGPLDALVCAFGGTQVIPFYVTATRGP